jgi:iron complex transport system ATP-binding protein
LNAERVLVVDAVHASYGPVEVLRDVSFEVADGEIFALLGPNGCGKTTLLRIIGKLVSPTAGTVHVAGRDVAATNQTELARLMATVAQVHRLSFPFSVLDILLTGRLPYVATFAVPGAHDVAHCREILEWFGIGHLESKRYTQLSGGERQLVMIARALAQEPRLLLLDEPTTYLDLHNQVLVLERIRELARRLSLTVLMTIHDPNQALAYAGRAALLRRLVDAPAPLSGSARLTNSVLAVGAPADVLSPARIMDAYGVKVDLIRHGSRTLLVPHD